jgi:hypothetical protein
MSIFLDESEIKQVVSSAIIEHHRSDGSVVLADRITKAVTVLLELKAVQAIAEGAKEEAKAEAIYSHLTREQVIRDKAYAYAAGLPEAKWGPHYLHKNAEEIATKIENGFTPAPVTPDVPDFQKFIDDIFGRNEWRREGWNDARSRMIRSINEQLASPSKSHVLNKANVVQLKIIRDFIGSFKFDPTKP